mgnify:CR=1 FL=1|jgi:hypothetical protein
MGSCPCHLEEFGSGDEQGTLYVPTFGLLPSYAVSYGYASYDILYGLGNDGDELGVIPWG